MEYIFKLPKICVILIFILFLTSCGINKSINHHPILTNFIAEIPEKVVINDSTSHVGNNLFYKNKYGFWELSVEGDPLQRGLLIGTLTEQLMYKQEGIFFDKINELVPSKSRQNFLRKFLSWYNRKIYKHITNEYKSEVFGMTQYASKEYNNIAPRYLRSLYLQGAHDIGHALQDFALVGCTSFAIWNTKSEDGKLLIGRNFDFYAGDAFAENKIMSFVKPSTGHNYVSISWAGMVGVVSGMNEHGLTVTINAGKSKIPFIAKTPISIVAREVLQYASNIEEAIAIASKREVFVSESILIGSAFDKKAILIEVSPNKFGVFDPENTNQLICSNHFQSDSYNNDKRNQKTILESHTNYRYNRMEELLVNHHKINPAKAAEILRNKEGKNDKKIGFGNKKSINHLLAHHSVIFQPEDLKIWVSTSPYQLGEFIGYDLNEVFNKRDVTSLELSLSDPSLTISKDPFLNTIAYDNYEKFRILERKVTAAIADNDIIIDADLQLLVNLNPEYWIAYKLLGEYHYTRQNYFMALKYFEIAATKEITTSLDVNYIAKLIKKSKRKLK